MSSLRHGTPAAFGVGVLAALVLVPDLFSLERVVPFAMLLAFRPAVAGGLLAGGLILVVARRRWWLSAVVTVAIAAVGLSCSAYDRALPDSGAHRDLPASSMSLTVLSFNVYDGHADVEALARTIKTTRPDVVVLPEAGQRYRESLIRTLGAVAYHSWTTGRPGGEDVNGIVVLTSATLGDVRAWPLGQGAKFRWMRLSGGHLGAATIVAIHTAAPVPGWVPAWSADLTALRAWCAPHAVAPVMLIGDFNATLDHRGLRAAGCTDAAAAVGNSLTATWPAYLPRWLGVQIDHILITGQIGPVSVRILDIPGSDHRAVLGTLVLARGGTVPD